MANQNGQVYGLTILSPIIEDERLDICHSMELRWYLGNLARDHKSPFAQISSTYLARLVVMDDVVYVGAPACEEHLQSRYLVFEANFDGDLDAYLTWMARETPEASSDHVSVLASPALVGIFISSPSHRPVSQMFCRPAVSRSLP